MILAKLEVGCAGLAVKVEGEGVGREKLGEGDGGVEVADGHDMVGGDAEALQLARDEAAEGVIADAGDDAGAVSEAGDRDGHVGRTAAKELSEGLDVFKMRPDLEREYVDAGAAHCQNVDIATVQGHAGSFLSVGATLAPDPPSMHYQ